MTSDLHFGHRNVAKFCPKTRGQWDTRNDPDTMNADMITMWNEIVEPTDTVYILGDVAFCKTQKAAELVNELNGFKILVAGNHDEKALRNPVFRACFQEIYDYLDMKYNGRHIVMCHYPIFDHNRAGHGALMLHGHRHGNPTNLPGRIMDVGFDATGNIVTDLDEIIEQLEQVPHMYHHNPNKY